MKPGPHAPIRVTNKWLLLLWLQIKQAQIHDKILLSQMLAQNKQLSTFLLQVKSPILIGQHLSNESRLCRNQ